MKARIRVELVSVTMRPIVPYTSLRSSIPPFAVQDASVSEDRKSTRLNSSHSQISYAVFCLKKKKNVRQTLSPATSSHCGFPLPCQPNRPRLSTTTTRRAPSDHQCLSSAVLHVRASLIVDSD